MRQSVQKVMASDPEGYHPDGSRLLFTQCWDCERGQHDFLCVVSRRTRLHKDAHNREMKTESRKILQFLSGQPGNRLSFQVQMF